MGAQKKAIPDHKQNGEDLQDCSFEFMWRRVNAGNLLLVLIRSLQSCRCAISELLRVNKTDKPWELTEALININDCVDHDSMESEEENDMRAK